MNPNHGLWKIRFLRILMLGFILYSGVNLPASAATYTLGLNEKYEQFSELMPLLRNDDTVLVTTPISSYCTVTGLRIAIIGKAASPKLVWDAGFGDPVFKNTLSCYNKARVTVENLEIRGRKGSTGDSYCPIFSCQMGSQGGRGESPVAAWSGSTVILKHCTLRGGAGGKGGVFGSRSCAVCGCSPCGLVPQYAPDGNTGYDLDLRDAAVAETLDVKVESVNIQTGAKVIACCSTAPVGLGHARSMLAPTPVNPMSMENGFRDIQGRKNTDATPPPLWLYGSRKEKHAVVGR